MKPKISKWLQAIALSLCAMATQASADDYPSKPIEIVTQSGVGGGGDVVARQMAEAAKGIISQPIVVTNKAGAGGRNLENYIRGAKPDGYTLVITTATSLSWYYTGSLDMDINKDLKPIIRLQVDPSVVVVRSDSPYKSMADIIAAGKAGKLTPGGLPIGSVEHMFFVKLAKDNDFPLNFVAYDGGGQSVTALLSGTVDVTMLQTQEAHEYVVGGQFRAIGVASAEREQSVDILKDVPTLKEQGIDFVLSNWRGLHTMADVPDDVVKYLYDHLQQATQTEGWVKWLKDSGQTAGNMDPAEFKKFTTDQATVLDAVATAAGLNKRTK